MNLDHELRQVLKPQDPPAGFAENVLRRATITDQAPTTPPHSRRSRWFALPIAASLLAAAFGWHHYVQRQRQTDAERATYEVILALHIAGETLVEVQKKVQDTLRNQNEPQRQN
jgi:hypothetical protein